MKTALLLTTVLGRTLGPDLVLNGSFGAGAGWTLTAQVSISGNALHMVSADGSYQYAAQSMGLVTGQRYEFAIEISRVGSGSIRFGSGLGAYSNITSQLGLQKFIFTATSAAIYIERVFGVTDVDATFVSVRKILPR